MEIKIFDLEKNKYLNIDSKSDFFNYGFGLFETIKISNGKLELFKEHISRMESSISTLFNLDIDLKLNTLKNKFIDIDKGACKIICFLNDDILNIGYKYVNRTYNKKVYSNGFKVRISKYVKNDKSLLTYHKTTNYMENILEKRLSSLEGYDESIFLNTEGFVSEGTMSNVFIVKDGVIITSPISAGILNGIIRAFILKNSFDIGIEVVEKNFSYYDLINADEIFLTNSLMHVMEVSKVDNYKFDISKNIFSKKISKYIKENI